MKRFYLVMAVVLFPVTAFSAPEIKGAPDELQRYLLEERSISVVSGYGEEKVRADTAIVSLVVKTKEDKFRTALDRNKKIRKEVKDKLIAGGIPEGKIETAKYSSTPTNSWFGDKPSSYTISNAIKVTIDKEDQLLLISDIVDSFTEVSFSKTEFKDSKKQESKTKALDKALADISSKKQLYEKSLGLTLSPVRVIDQTISDDAIPVALAAPRKTKVSESMVNANADEGAAGFGEIVYKARTQIEYIVTPKR